MGIGIGVVASMAYNADEDRDLVAIPAHHLFEPSTTKIGFRRGTFLRTYMYDFIENFAPHLTKPKVEEAMRLKTHEEIEQLFAKQELPTL